jgi:16S rRNA U516 pseudouridylate synthase RsuA-like enzyme
VRVGPITLGQLQAGTVRDLEPDEVRALQRAAGR